MQKLVQRKRKEFIVAPKVMSSFKVESCVIPLDIEQFREIPKAETRFFFFHVQPCSIEKN